jgi:hypothetical protein
MKLRTAILCRSAQRMVAVVRTDRMYVPCNDFKSSKVKKSRRHHERCCTGEHEYWAERPASQTNWFTYYLWLMLRTLKTRAHEKSTLNFEEVARVKTNFLQSQYLSQSWFSSRINKYSESKKWVIIQRSKTDCGLFWITLSIFYFRIQTMQFWNRLVMR